MIFVIALGQEQQLVTEDGGAGWRHSKVQRWGVTRTYIASLMLYDRSRGYRHFAQNELKHSTCPQVPNFLVYPAIISERTKWWGML